MHYVIRMTLDELLQRYYVIQMTSASTLKLSGWDSKFFHNTRWPFSASVRNDPVGKPLSKSKTKFCANPLDASWQVKLSHPGDIMGFKPCHPDDLAVGNISSGWLMANALCHSDDLRFYPMLSGRHDVIWTLSHPDKLAPDRISSDDLWPMLYVIRMTYHTIICHPDDSADVGISSGWVIATLLCHPDDMRFHS